MLVPSWRGPRQHGQFSAATVAIPAISSRVEIKSNRDTSRFRGRSSFGFPSSFDIRPSTFPPGAGGGTRTHTAFYGPRILSPVRLPFRHTGKNSSCRSETKSRIRFRKELTVPSEGGFHGL